MEASKDDRKLRNSQHSLEEKILVDSVGNMAKLLVMTIPMNQNDKRVLTLL